MNTDKCIWECDEDDLFYAELRDQVLLLTAEDEDTEELQENKLKYSYQRFNSSPSSSIQQGCYYNWSGNEAAESAPTWMFNLWKSGNGTGVFIPQIVKTRRKQSYKQRRKNNERGMRYKPVADVKA